MGVRHKDLQRPPLGLDDIVPVPVTWRVVSGAWDVLAGFRNWDRASLVGWDGDSIIVASLQQELPQRRNWTVQPQFRISSDSADWCIPYSGDCRLGEHVGKYEDVVAMQLGANGATLAILHKA